MTTSTMARPARKLDEFEELVYMYAARMGPHDESQEQHALRIRDKRAPAQVSFLFSIAPKMCNFLGNLHGGCAATLVDVLSTVILMGVSSPGQFSLGGVSRNLKITYLRPVPRGTEVRLTCELVHVGRRLALLRAEIRRVDNGNLCVVGEHEKANTDPEVDQRI
ncbi:putative thioesterase family protein [Aspergillus campestris IBT 28561]|uniref:Thioesterase family protein n=1 Tax=Aspergillus campestris (strain IBT 28561) TaxID=1392248 RepID=A0A2I1CV14_ASPC2|nr:putative thioesterase family protein [Aspergillus campestris IBT 28561]PKY01468.1 putative thioesterase family protein [Aspergillus campestris IBT 28561]